jgi:CDP-diacylglycerol--glycerol-3-phosphate 3-phosphatidyltransferase
MAIADLPTKPTVPDRNRRRPESEAPQFNVPNVITLVRTVAAMTLAAAGLAERNLWLIAAAYAVYWAGDMADGFFARRPRWPTRPSWC